MSQTSGNHRSNDVFFHSKGEIGVSALSESGADTLSKVTLSADERRGVGARLVRAHRVVA